MHAKKYRHNGKLLGLWHWRNEPECAVTFKTLWNRVNVHNWSFKTALTTPRQKVGRYNDKQR